MPCSLDYYNSLFINIESTQPNGLQLIQNSLTRAVNENAQALSHHSRPEATALNNISERIHFKVLSLTYNSLQDS